MLAWSDIEHLTAQGVPTSHLRDKLKQFENQNGLIPDANGNYGVEAHSPVVAWFLRLLSHLFPPAERDTQFQEFLASLSDPGLKSIAAVEIAAPAFLLLVRLAAEARAGVTTAALLQVATTTVVGLITLAWLRWRPDRRYMRLASALSVWAACAFLMGAAAWRPYSFRADDYVLAGIAMVVLTGAATVPFRPMHALALTLAVAASDLGLTSLFGAAAPSLAQHNTAHHLFLFILAPLVTGIASINYEHRRQVFQAHQQSIRAAEALTGAQLRAQLAENAISIGKMAAALSHEINSPLGALRSSIETLLAITGREVDAPPVRREILEKMREELVRSIGESSARIEDVMSRLQRFVNLEEAELKSADINELVSDVSLLYQEQIRTQRIALEFQLEKPMPRLICRPQLLSAAFSSLLSNAVNAVDGDGHITISTRRHGSAIEIAVADNGRGMNPEDVDSIFDPALKVDGGRVASGNWSLFNSRQIVYEHGGEIRLDTAVGRGTTVYVTLPLVQPDS